MRRDGARENPEPPTFSLLDGWAEPEAGFTWSLGQESRFRIAAGTPDGTAMLELDLNPFVPPGSSAGQRLAILVNGARIGEARILGEGTVGYVVPRAALTQGGHLLVTLHHPDCSSPADHGLGDDRRPLAFMLRRATIVHLPEEPACPPRILPPLPLPDCPHSAILKPALERLTGLSAEALMEDFESLGRNCEFGLVQRHCGIEPLSLFRFAGVTLPDLLAGLECGFAGLGAPDEIEVVLSQGPRPEFLVRDRRYGISIHTLRFADETDGETVRREQGGQLRFFHRKFMEVLETGERLFVFQRPGQTLVSHMHPLLNRLRRHGPNALLVVTDDPARPAGTVEQLGATLFHGFIDRLAPSDDAGQCNLAAWMSCCLNARRLWNAQMAQTGTAQAGVAG